MTAQRQTVLVVDNAPENVAILAAALGDMARVRVATSGERALTICRSAEPPDLVLLDVVMPGLDGYAVCEQLQTDAKTQSIPVIFVSGNAGREDEERCYRAGGVDVVPKPVDIAQVRRRVATHLELVALRRQVAALQATLSGHG